MKRNYSQTTELLSHKNKKVGRATWIFFFLSGIHMIPLHFILYFKTKLELQFKVEPFVLISTLWRTQVEKMNPRRAAFSFGFTWIKFASRWNIRYCWWISFWMYSTFDLLLGGRWAINVKRTYEVLQTENDVPRHALKYSKYWKDHGVCWHAIIVCISLVGVENLSMTFECNQGVEQGLELDKFASVVA